MSKKRQRENSIFSIDSWAFQSYIYDWNVYLKLLFFSVMMGYSLLGNPYMGLSVILLSGIFCICIGGISFERYVKFLIIPLTFILLGSFTLLFEFTKMEPEIEHLKIFGFYIYTTYQHLKNVIGLWARAFGALSALYILVLNTPMYEILSAFSRLKFPPVFLQLMNMVYRFIFILSDVWVTMKNSAESRLGFIDYRTSLVTFGKVNANIFIVSLKKANNYYVAMESRCYDGELNFFKEKKAIEWKQIFIVTVFMIVPVLVYCVF